MRTDGLIVVKASITLKTTEEGGRHAGIKSGCRPNHFFENPGNLNYPSAYIGDIQFDDQVTLEPGETKTVTVRFIKVPAIEKYIVVGQKWFINEGGRTIGVGEILEI